MFLPIIACEITQLVKAMSLIQPARGVLEKLRRQLWPSRNGPPRGKSKDFRAENDLLEGMVGSKKGIKDTFTDKQSWPKQRFYRTTMMINNWFRRYARSKSFKRRISGYHHYPKHSHTPDEQGHRHFYIDKT